MQPHTDPPTLEIRSADKKQVRRAQGESNFESLLDVLNVGSRRGSSLLVWVEDIVLRLHDRMTSVAAVGEAFWIGCELV